MKTVSSSTDTTATLADLIKQATEFVEERDWQQFHDPKSLSMDIAVEAAELMEKFLWIASQDADKEVIENRKEIEHELADVFFGILCFCSRTNIDLTTVFLEKLALIKEKYPVSLSKGRSTKYTKLHEYKDQKIAFNDKK